MYTSIWKSCKPHLHHVFVWFYNFRHFFNLVALSIVLLLIRQHNSKRVMRFGLIRSQTNDWDRIPYLNMLVSNLVTYHKMKRNMIFFCYSTGFVCCELETVWCLCGPVSTRRVLLADIVVGIHRKADSWNIAKKDMFYKQVWSHVRMPVQGQYQSNFGSTKACTYRCIAPPLKVIH